MQVLALSETFGRADKPALLSPTDNYVTWNTERSGSDKGGGGLTILYKDTLTAHEWTPAVPKEQEYVKNERQWLLLNTQGGEKCAFLHCYIACQSFKSDDYLQWNEDLFFLLQKEAITLRNQNFLVLAMGDFNSKIGIVPGLEGNHPATNRNQPMFNTFITAANLFIINTLPLSKGMFTRFMGGGGPPKSESLLDYGLIDNEHVHTVSSFVIDDEARYACGSDHALLECEIILGTTPHITWSYQDVIQYDFKENSSFDSYQRGLDASLDNIPLSQFSAMKSEEMLPHITQSIKDSAMANFGLKIKKVKKGMKLPKPIISKIKYKNHLAKSLQDPMVKHPPQEYLKLLRELETLKHQIKIDISEIKLRRRHRLRSRLLRADPTKRKFWRFLKSQMSSAGNISALYKVNFHRNSTYNCPCNIKTNKKPIKLKTHVLF